MPARTVAIAMAALLVGPMAWATEDCGGAISANKAKEMVGKTVHTSDGKTAGKVAMVMEPGPGVDQRFVIALHSKQVVIPAEKVRSNGSGVTVDMSQKELMAGTPYDGGIKLDPSNPCGR